MNPHLPPPMPLQVSLDRYRVALTCLDRPKTPIKHVQALEILIARDELQKQMEAEMQIPENINILPEIQELDSYLKHQAYRITESINLAQYRGSLPISSQHWWWNLETTGDPHPWTQYDLSFKGIRLAVWVVNLGLLGTLAARFLSGGPGWFEAIAIAFPTILALLQGKNELTETGQEGLDKLSTKLLTKLGLSPHLKEEAKLVWTLVGSVVLVSVWLQQPLISRLYNQEGKRQQEEENQLINAEGNYLKAIAFDSGNPDPHYNLGNLYEEWLDVDNAQKQYAIAIKSDLPDAYNNLARLYIRQGKSLEAMALLRPIVQKVMNNKSFCEKVINKNCEEVKYSLLKNYGWVSFERGQDDQAMFSLQNAVEIADNPKIRLFIPNPGAAHCLLAKLMERLKSPPQAKVEWQQCQKLIGERLNAGKKIQPQEYSWLESASKKLNN